MPRRTFLLSACAFSLPSTPGGSRPFQPGGEGWLGGAAIPGAPGGLLYRWHQGEWVDGRTAPDHADRTFVLDVDPFGVLWLCAYSPPAESTYGGLRVRRYDG